MADRTRNHAVTFRLGDRQYEELVRAVERRGARSVSEFTRAAVLAQIVSNHPEQMVERELDGIMAQVEELDAKVRDLRRQLRQTAAVSRAAGV